MDDQNDTMPKLEAFPAHCDASLFEDQGDAPYNFGRAPPNESPSMLSP